MLTKAKIILIKSLKDKKERRASNLFVAEGTKLVPELITSSLRVREVFALHEAMDDLPFCDNMTEVTPKEMERISHLKTASHALALVEIPRYEYAPDVAQNNLILALDDIQDPGNLGTIVRLADWFGIHDIFCTPSTADCFNPKVVQATMGAIARVRMHYLDLPAFLAQAAGQNIPVYGTFLEGENIYRAPLTPHGIIVMGNEGKGVSAPVAAHINRQIYIPPYPAGTPAGESLNVAIATAIVCSEFRRR